MKNVGGCSHNAFWIINMGKNQENGKEKYFKIKTFEIEKISLFLAALLGNFRKSFLKRNLLTLHPGMEDYLLLPQLSGLVQTSKGLSHMSLITAVSSPKTPAEVTPW